MIHERYKEMLAIIALAAQTAREDDEYASAPADFIKDFSEEERDALDVHLAGCVECRTELAALRDAVAMLAYTAPSVAPSADVRDKILARVGRVEKTSDDESGTPIPAIYTTENASVSPQPVSNVIPLSSGRPRPLVETNNGGEQSAEIILHPNASGGAMQTMKGSGNWFLKFGMLAASIALAAALVGLFVLWQQNNALDLQLAQLTKQQQATNDELVRVRADQNILTAPDARTLQLSGTSVAPNAHANLAYDKQTGRAILFAANLPPAPNGKAYQIWYIADGKPLPGKVFKTDSQGRATLHDDIPVAGRNATLFAVTLEPEMGVQTPSGEKYLLSSTS